MKNFYLMMATQLDKLPAQFATNEFLMCIRISTLGPGTRITRIDKDLVLNNKHTLVDAYLINLSPEDITYLALMGVTVRAEVSRNNVKLNEIYDKGWGMHP